MPGCRVGAFCSVSSHRENAKASAVRNAAVGPASATQSADLATRQIRADVSRFFVDLRRTIGTSAAGVAHQLKTTASVIAALESADVDRLPAWPETQRIVMGYAAWAGIDGRPVLTALGILAREAEQRRQTARQAEAVRPAVNASSERLRQIQAAIAEGARRLPQEALNQARERPVRTFYTLSLPLALLLLLLNPQGVGAAVTKPFKAVITAAHDMLAVSFAPHREGLRWIEVSDPRTRRADRLSPAE